MRNCFFILTGIFLLTGAVACKQKESTGKEEKQVQADTARANAEKVTVPESQAAETTPGDGAAAQQSIWLRIEKYLNTSKVEQDPVLKEVQATMGRDMYLDVKELWYLTQFNIKKKLSRGVSNLNAANFQDKYEEQYDKAIAGGY